VAEGAAGVARLLAPRSVAVVGASPGAGKIGNVLMRNLAGFPGPVFPVHPTAPEVLSRRAFASVSAIPEDVDLALLAIPAEAVPGAIKDCAAKGVGGAVIYSGGWAESGDAGRARQEEILGVARAAGVRLLGPNTSGFVRPGRGLFATFVADLPRTIKDGPLAIVAQSGGVNLTLCFLAENEGVGVRLGVGLGNAVDVGFADVLAALAEDDGASVVALAIEGIAEGRAFFEAVERLAARRPVVAVKVGRADVSSFARSHTGALTGSYRVTRAALAQAGAVVVDDLTELMDAARALGAARLPPLADPGVGVVTAQAGTGLLLADALLARGVRLPTLGAETRARLSRLLPPLTFQENPVDTGRPSATFGDVLRAVREAPGVDLLAVSLLHEPDAVDPATALAGAAPAVLSSQGPREEIDALRARVAAARVPLFATPDRTARAVHALVRDARRRSQRMAAAGDAWTVAVPETRPATGRWDEDAGKALVAALGIATPRRVVCATRDEARAALATLGGPVAVKLLHEAVLHKTEVGGVHLAIADEAALARALDAIDRTAGARYLVEEMAPAGPELLVGARRDASFGPIVVLGAGGIGAEAEDDLAVRLAPLSRAEARGMLSELASAWRYRGHRGAPAVDEEALASALAALGALITARTDIAEVEVNPLRVTARGLFALDALVVGT